MPLEGDPFAGAAREGRTLAAGDLAHDERFDARARALLGVPAHASLLAASFQRGAEHGVVVVLFSEPREFSEDDLALARQLSGAARGALERSEHFESVIRARSLSEGLAALGARLVTNLTPEDVLDEAVREEARNLLGADAAAIRLLEDDELVVRAASGRPAERHRRRTPRAPGTGLLGDVAQSRRLSAVEDVRGASPSRPRRPAARRARWRRPSRCRSWRAAAACAAC